MPDLLDLTPDVLEKAKPEELAILSGMRVEMERRKAEEQIRYYGTDEMPFFEHQEKLHRSKARNRLGFGSNRSGKTFAEGAEINWYATRTHPFRKTPKPPVRMRWCTEDYKTIKKVIIPTLKKLVVREDLRGGSWEKAYSKEEETLYWANGSFVELMTYQQDVASYEGASRHLVVEDECCPSDIHHANMARLIDTKGDLIMGLTPINLTDRTGWIYDWWKQVSEGRAESAEWFFFDIWKNTILGRAAIDEYAASLPEGERIARIEGKFPQLLGLVYKTFKRAKHVIPAKLPPKGWTIEITADPHPRMPTAVIFGAIDKSQNKYIWDELWISGTTKVILDEIRAKLFGYRLGRAIMDDSAKAENIILGNTSIWKQFLDPDGDNSDKGIYFLTVSGTTKSIPSGIRLVEDHLGLDAVYQKPKLFIMDNCVHTIAQFESYCYEDYRNRESRNLSERPKKRDDHFMDCVRYWLKSNPYFVPAELLKMPDPVYDSYFGNVVG